jgi:long-chain acyl-CoA synthetase
LTIYERAANPSAIFLQQVHKYGDGKIALRQKEFGIWREFSWQESYQQVRDFALGLIVLGVQRGDKVCTIGDNDRFYLWGYLGLLAAGATQVGIYTDAIPDESGLHHAATAIPPLPGKRPGAVRQAAGNSCRLPAMKRVIYWEDKGCGITTSRG